MLTQKGKEPFIRMKLFLDDEHAVHKLVASQYKIVPEKLMRTGNYTGTCKFDQELHSPMIIHVGPKSLHALHDRKTFQIRRIMTKRSDFGQLRMLMFLIIMMITLTALALFSLSLSLFLRS